jgi:hypothetical protein
MESALQGSASGGGPDSLSPSNAPEPTSPGTSVHGGSLGLGPGERDRRASDGGAQGYGHGQDQGPPPLALPGGAEGAAAGGLVLWPPPMHGATAPPAAAAGAAALLPGLASLNHESQRAAGVAAGSAAKPGLGEWQPPEDALARAAAALLPAFMTQNVPARSGAGGAGRDLDAVAARKGVLPAPSAASASGPGPVAGLAPAPAAAPAQSDEVTALLGTTASLADAFGALHLAPLHDAVGSRGSSAAGGVPGRM